MKTPNCQYLVFLIITFVLVFCSCNYIPFSGPIDSKKFERFVWNELEITYWVVTNTDDFKKWEETERKLVINGSDIEKLRKIFKTDTCKGSALGSVRPWNLHLDDGKQWYMELAGPNACFFCNMSNTDIAYFVKLKNTDFFQELKNLCYENEKFLTPDIDFDNIRICRRFGRNTSPQEKIVAFQGVPGQPISSGPKTPDSGANSEDKPETSKVDTNALIDKSEQKE